MDLSTLGRQFGLTPEQTQAAFEALAPVVAAGVRRNSQDDGGFADLIGALAGGNHGRYVEDPDVLASTEAISDGNAILGHVFGSKDVSRGVAQQLSASTGIGESILKKMLPIIAALVMGQLAKNTRGGGGNPSGGGGLGDILGQVLGGGAQGGGGLADILGQVLGGGQSQPRQAPSGGGGGLGDILGDLLGGAAAPEQREQVARGRKTLDEILGGGSSRGSAADDLLASVERSLRRR